MPFHVPYIELHAHSGYSFLDGASHPQELVLQAKEPGYPALACGPATSRPDEPPALFHLTLLAETPTGYANLCRLLTTAHRTSPRGAPALELDRCSSAREG